MKRGRFSLVTVLVLCITMVFSGFTVQAATTKNECESMTLGGSYAGRISSPFSGVALYANDDYCQVSGVSLSNTSTTISVRGCSNNSSTASVVVKMNGYNMGTLTFTGTTPTVKSITVTPMAGTYTIQLIVTNDTGAWDAYVDYMEISGATSGGSTGGSTSGSNGNVYLCFDDGPNNSTSATLVNSLKSAGCTKATFFIWGNRISYNSSAWSTLCNSGFSLQNHSYTHSHMTSWSYQQVYNDLNQCNQAIVNAGKAKPNYVRLPYLESNSTIRQACSALGLTIVNPTVYSQDWSGASTSSIVSACNNLTAGGNVLMHDGYSTTISAIPSIVSNMKAKGFGFAQY